MDEGPYEVQGVSMGETVLRTEAPRKGRENAGQKVGQFVAKQKESSRVIIRQGIPTCL